MIGMTLWMKAVKDFGRKTPRRPKPATPKVVRKARSSRWSTTRPGRAWANVTREQAETVLNAVDGRPRKSRSCGE